ncbi:hypothetical protein BXZ70DRAFT_586786 [Cristinia sonorae]|uniref:Uncharacterized protein n=1 Tax=Cristinia sonorae TaxID=1940300 RepID=A0A8K0UFR3_9AGAR|nr:hypothetical protein BXZ70DRAFT_586786 [Cristinia sonorae]
MSPSVSTRISTKSSILFHSETYPPLRMRAAHFLLYFWIYCADFDDSSMTLMRTDAHNVPHQFVQDLDLCHRSISRHLAVKISSVLRLEYVVNEPAERLLYLLTTFVESGSEALASAIGQHPQPEIGLLASLLVGCQRQLCFLRESTRQLFVDTTIRIITTFFDQSQTAESARNEFVISYMLANNSAIFSYAIISAVERNREVELDMAPQLLGYTQTLLRA